MWIYLCIFCGGLNCNVTLLLCCRVKVTIIVAVMFYIVLIIFLIHEKLIYTSGSVSDVP